MLQDDISKKYVCAQLIIMGMATGALDAISYPALGIFLSNQTGNSVFLFVSAFGLAERPSMLPDVAVSLGVFLTFLLLAGQLGNRIGRRKRWWLLITNFVQSSLILVVGAVEAVEKIHEHPRKRFIVIAVMSASSGMQVAAAKSLGCPEVPTAMLTSPYADLLTDVELFKRNRGSSRDKRLLYILFFCIGTAAGAAFYRYISTSSGIFVAGGVKMAVTASFLLNPAQRAISEEDIQSKMSSSISEGDKAGLDSPTLLV